MRRSAVHSGWSIARGGGFQVLLGVGAGGDGAHEEVAAGLREDIVADGGDLFAARRLENRLILLKRRLDEREVPIRLEKTGRGRFRLLVSAQPLLELVDT